MAKSSRRKAPSKLPSVAVSAPSGKTPRADSPDDNYVAWRFGMIDFSGPWCWTTLQGDKKKEIYGKLGEYERRRWTEFAGKGGTKNIPVANLGREAKLRLRDLDKDDVDGSLWELRFSNKERIWGVRQGDIMHFLWWDPLHEVCPSKKR